MSDNEHPFQDWSQLWEQWQEIYGTMNPWWPPSAAGLEPGEMMHCMTKAHLATVEAGVSYMTEWADLSRKAYTLSARAMGLSGSTEPEKKQELGKVTDELRAVYRQMAELPLTSTRHLQTRVAEIWQDSRPGGSEKGADEPIRRSRPKA